MCPNDKVKSTWTIAPTSLFVGSSGGIRSWCSSQAGKGTAKSPIARAWSPDSKEVKQCSVILLSCCFLQELGSPRSQFYLPGGRIIRSVFMTFRFEKDFASNAMKISVPSEAA
jgi:hypothetical protein